MTIRFCNNKTGSISQGIYLKANDTPSCFQFRVSDKFFINILVNKLQSRRNALEEYNKMKGLNITVEVNENILSQAQQLDTTGILDQPIEGGE